MTFPINLFIPPAFIGNVGPVELGVVFVIVLIVFGPGKLPDVFKAFGTGVKQFKDAAAGITEEGVHAKTLSESNLIPKAEMKAEEKQLTEV